MTMTMTMTMTITMTMTSTMTMTMTMTMTITMTMTMTSLQMAWGLVIDNQRATGTAFPLLAMFRESSSFSNNSRLHF